jgi:hypothetical protein
VKTGALEGLEAAELGPCWTTQASACRNENPRSQGPSVARFDYPQAIAVIESSADDSGSEAQMVPDAVFGRATNEIFQDFGLWSELTSPPRVWLERKRIKMGLNVARRARIPVVPPSPTDFVGFLEHDEVSKTRLLEADGHADPSETSANNHDSKNGRIHGARLSSEGTPSTDPPLRGCAGRRTD